MNTREIETQTQQVGLQAGERVIVQGSEAFVIPLVHDWKRLDVTLKPAAEGVFVKPRTVSMLDDKGEQVITGTYFVVEFAATEIATVVEHASGEPVEAVPKSIFFQVPEEHIKQL